MKKHLIYFIALILISHFLQSCKENKKQEEQKDVKIELCQGKYLNEEAAAIKLDEYAKTYSNAMEWKDRAQKIEAQIIKGAGLNEIPQSDWNYPIKVKHGQKHQMAGYSVENIALELKPAYWVHGNLYMPDSLRGKTAIVLNPHGHWFKPYNYGRFRPDMQFRCAALAKMGAMAINWDMYGTGEDTAHKHKSPESLTMQTFNTIRILDYVSSLAEVDTNKIAVTGASGGGTQTFIASAIDDRIDVSIPTVMVSAHFFGGCVCESGKPIHKQGAFETNNVEIAACFAPKPLMLISDGDDWTANVPKVEFPYIQNVYNLYGAENNIENAHFKDEKHDFGFSKRQVAYQFLAKHLKLDIAKISDIKGNIDESFVQLLDTTQLKVFPEKFLVKQPMKD